MKKLTVLSTSLLLATSLGFSADALAGHRDGKKHHAEKNQHTNKTMDKMKNMSDEANATTSDLINEAGGAANRAVGAASRAIGRIGDHFENGLKKMDKMTEKKK